MAETSFSLYIILLFTFVIKNSVPSKCVTCPQIKCYSTRSFEKVYITRHKACVGPAPVALLCGAISPGAHNVVGPSLSLSKWASPPKAPGATVDLGRCQPETGTYGKPFLPTSSVAKVHPLNAEIPSALLSTFCEMDLSFKTTVHRPRK